MIEGYSFGRITIDGKSFSRDLIIFRDRVRTDWWRVTGHEVCADDVKEIVEAAPNAPARIDEARLLTGKTYRHQGALVLEISWSCDDPEMAFHLGVGLNRPDEVEVASFLSHRSDAGPWTGSTHHTVRLEIPELPLVKNTFKLYVFLLAEDGLHIHDTRILEDAFSVEYDDYPFGIVAIPHQWRVVGDES